MLVVESFLSAEKLSELQEILAATPYIDGSKTGGNAGRLIKQNLQAKERDPNYKKANHLVYEAILQCPDVQGYAYPHKMTPVRFAKYGEGMKYGNHFDAGLMPVPNGVLRTDLSFTLFLSDPESYEGGELVVDLLGAEKSIKLNQGDLVMYPSGNPHRVNEVTKGIREVAVGWVQSMYASPEQRKIMWNIGTVRYQLMQDEGPGEKFDLLNQAHVMLERMWGNP